MTYEERLAALTEFCERQGWECHTYDGSQREPETGVTINQIPGLRRCNFETRDGDRTIPLARAEQFLMTMKRAGSDAYLHEPHPKMGAL